MALALLLLGFAATAVAGPVASRYSPNTFCAGFCPENTKFGFETGKTYEYDYTSMIKTHIPGASTDHSSLQMHAVAKLEIISQCEMALRLDSVELKDFAPGTNHATSAARSGDFASAMQRNALRFAFVSGNVESVCPGHEEDTWVLNIKRALLSHLQNTMNDFHVDFRSRETDVTGDCPVTYTTESAGWNGVHTIKKVKEIDACTKRLSADTVLQGTAYRTPSRMQSLPLMKGSQECYQKINTQGVLIESACTESHIFRPFSKGSSGATTDITTKMSFKQETTGVMTGQACGDAKPITFDHEKTHEELTNSRREAEHVLREMCTQTTRSVSAVVPSLFGKLIRALKKLDTSALLSLHSDVTNGGFCHHAETFLHDAVPNLGTEASARLIKNMVLSGEITGTKSTLWLTSLSFIQKPTATMLAEVAPLLSTSPLNRHAALAVSSLVNNFCKVTTSCGTIQVVREITAALEMYLTRGCAKSERKYAEVITALKALGNTGHGNAELLNTCIRNSDIAMDVRITAINAFRHMGCATDKSELVHTFENTNLDAELRINAYLSLMVCPTTDILRRVRNMLHNEKVNQVGSFVWTHLTNLMETSSPLKQEIRQVVEQESLRKEFNVDKRKFSRNIEKSYFSEVLNSGASVESNIIFSPESFVPRSASVNLTTDLFGHSVNLVEIGGRVEGINGLLDDLFNTHAPAEEHRETTPDINRLDENFAERKRATPMGSAYIRIFGNEIAYGDFHDLDATTVIERFNYLKWLMELAKEHTIDFSKSFQFLDTNVNVATITGFPLRMHIEGNAVTNIMIKGKLDLRHLVNSPRSLMVDGSIAPSAAMEITAEMGVDAFISRTGIRTVDTVHTSTVTDVTIELREGKIFAMDVKMAHDKMEIFSAKHDLFVVYREEVHEMTMPAARFTYSKCIAGMFTTITGLEMCAEVAVPSTYSTSTGPYVPLTAPAHVAVVLNKRDTFSSYHFEAKALREMVANGNQMDTIDVALLTFNTPGSHVNRELTMDFSLNHSQKKVSFTFVTPWMPRAHISGSFLNTDAMKRANIHVDFGTITYAALAEVEIHVNKYNTRYLPKFELRMPNGVHPTVSGSLIYRAGRKIDVNMVAENFFKEPMTVEGIITGISDTKKMRYETTLNIKTPFVRGKVNGFLDRTDMDGAVYSTRLEVFSTERVRYSNDHWTFSSKIRNKNSAKKTEMSGTIGFASSTWPAYDTDVNFSILGQGKTLSSTFEASLAGDKSKTLRIVQSGLLNWSAYTKKANMKIDVSLPYMNIDYTLNLAHIYKKGHMQSSATLFKEDKQHGLLAVNFARESLVPLKANVDIKFEYPERQMRYQQSIEEIKKKQYRTELSLQLKEGQTIVFTADYKMLPHNEIEAHLTTPFTSPFIFTGYFTPSVRNFRAKASVEHKTNRYAAEATMNLKSNDNRISIHFLHPSRTITTDMEMKTVGKVISGLFETRWDAMRDGNKKFSLAGEATLSKMRPRLEIKAEVFPGKFLEITTNGAFLQNRETCNNQGAFTFRSSFEHFEEVSASFKHKKNPSEITATGQASWAPDKKIDGGFALNLHSGWKKIDANAQLITPFAAVKHITYQLDYAFEGNTFNAKTKGIFNKHNIGFVLNGLRESQRIEVSMIMTSSIPQLKKLVLKANHVDTGRKCHTDAELTWGIDNKIALIYNMEHARSGFYLTNTGDLEITTPFKGYRKNKITWTHTNDESSIKHHAEIEMFKKTFVYDFDGSFNTVNNRRHLQIKSFLTGHNTNMKFNMGHEHQINNAQGIKTNALLQWKTGKFIQITNDFNMDSTKLWESFKFTSPFEGFETITATLDNSLTDNAINARNEIDWPHNKITFNGRMSYDKYEYDGHFRLETPFIPTQKITLSNKMRGTKNVRKNIYEYAPEQVLELTTSWEKGRTNTCTLEFTSPFELMQSVKFETQYSGTYRDFTVRANFFHNLLGDMVELNTHMDTADLSNVKGTFNLKTPNHFLANLHVMYSHRLQGKDFHCSAIFEIPFYKATFNHEMTINGWEQFNTKTAIMFKPGQKIELITQFQHTMVTIAAVTFRSPFFNDMEEIAFNLKSEGVKSIFDASVDKITKFTGAFEYSRAKGIYTAAQLTTPFHGYKKLGFTFNFEGQMTDIKLDWAVHHEMTRIVGHTTFIFRNGQMNLHFTLATPYPGYENIILTFNKEGSLYNFNSQGHFEFPDHKFTMKNNFALTSTGINLKSEIRTPFKFMNIFTVEVMHRGFLKDFKNSVFFLLNHMKYEANSHFKLTRNLITGNAALLLPEEYSIKFKHIQDEENFNSNILMKYAENHISGERTSTYHSNGWEGSHNIEAIFAGYEKFSFIGSHHGPLHNFHCDYTIELGNKKVTIKKEFVLAGHELKVKLDISTPYTNLRNINVDFTHRGSVSNFRNGGYIKINHNRYTFDSEFTYTPRSLIGHVTFNLPREYSLAVTHHGTFNDFRNNFAFKAGMMAINGMSEFKMNNGIEMSWTLNTPFNKVGNIIFKFTHKGAPNNFEEVTTLIHGSNTYTKKVKYEKTANEIHLKCELKTPFEALRALVIEANHNGINIKNFRNNIDIVYNGRKWFAGTDCKWSNNIFKLKATAHLPEDYTLLLTHKVGNTRFDTNMKITTPFSTIDGNLAFENMHGDIIGSFVLTTPFTHFRSQRIAFEHKKAGKGFVSKLNVHTSLPFLKSMEATLNHVGSYKHFTTSGKINLDNQELMVTISHQGGLSDFASSTSMTLNGKNTNGELTFKKTGFKITSSGSLTTPVEGFEKMTFNFNHEGRLNNFMSTLSVDLNNKLTTCKVTSKIMTATIETSVSLSTPFTGYERMAFNFNHDGHLADFTSGVSLVRNHQAITGQVIFKKTPKNIGITGTITTPFAGYEEIRYAVQGHVTATASNALVKINGPNASFKITFEKTGNAITSSALIVTPFADFEKMTFNFNHEGLLTDFSSGISMAINDDIIKGQLAFKMAATKMSTSLSVSTPFAGYERIIFAFESHMTAERTQISMTMSGPVTMEFNFEKVRNRLTSSASLTRQIAASSNEHFAFNFNHEGSMKNFHTILTIETPFKKYDNFGVDIKHEWHSSGIKSSMEIETPFEGYKKVTVMIKHDGHVRDFHTTALIAGSIKHMKLELTHKGDLSAFNTEGMIEINHERFSSLFASTHTLRYANGNIDASGSMDLPQLGHYVYNLKHQKNANGFATEGLLQTPHEGFERASFDLTHERTMNNFATFVKLNPFIGEGSFSVNHARTINGFTSTARSAWKTMNANGKIDFKKEEGKMEASAILATSFKGWELFETELKHYRQPKRIFTEARIITPFKYIRDPSFVLDHRGHWKNFKTSVSITTPCLTIQPMTITVNHRGVLRDFTTNGNIRYGRKTMSANIRYERTDNGFTGSADLNTPFRDAEKFGMNVQHSYDGHRLNMKGSIETPHHIYKHFALEVNHEGNLRKFDTTGRFEMSFTKAITFEMHHNGVPTDFESRAFVEYNGDKFECHAHYHKTGMSHEGFIKMTTPHSYLYNAEATLTHSQEGNHEIFGNLKAAYNTHNFEGDYRFTKATKSIIMTLDSSENPTAGIAQTFSNWKSNSPDKQLRFEGMLKNTNTDREITLTATWPNHVRKLMSGYQRTENRLFATIEVQSDDIKLQEKFELTKTTRGREIVYDGSFKTVSPIVNFELNGNHKINPGRRYMTEINIITEVTTMMRSDIRTPGGLADFSSTFMIAHPSFTKNVVVAVDGKIDPENSLYECKLDLEYANEKIIYTGKIADESTRYRTKWTVQSNLKHPSNKVDVAFETMLFNNKKNFNMKSKFAYMMSATNELNTHAVIINFNKVTDEFKINFASPVRNFDVKICRTINEESHQHVTVWTSVDGHNMNAEIDIERTIPSFSTSLHYGPEKSLHMYAKFISADHFKMEAYRQVSGHKYPEAAIDTEIVNGHLLKSRFFLRPSIVTDLSELFSINSGFGHFFTEMLEVIVNDLSMKITGFKHDIEPILQTLENLAKNLEFIAQHTEILFNRNLFYTYDIAKTVAHFFKNIRSTIDVFITKTIGAIKGMQHWYIEGATNFDHWRKEFIVKYNNWHHQVAAKMTEYRVEFHRKIAAHMTNMQESLVDCVNWIYKYPQMQAFITHVQARAERIFECATVLASKFVETADHILTHPRLSFSRKYFSWANEKCAWIIEQVHFKMWVYEWLHQVETVLIPIRHAAWIYTRDMLHLEETRFNTWAPERGEIAGQIYVPMLMRDLHSFPTFSFGGFMDRIKSHIPDTDWVFWDTLYAYKPSSDIRDWIPPFKSHATIAGNQHYMTFDKKFYEFAGECSYLLARDFIDGTFSVIVNYEARGNVATKKSMTIVHGKNQVEILPEFRVEMNGRRTELPIISEHTAVYRVGNTLRIDNDHGVKITCHLAHDHCTVAVTGWYFGKTAGLFGTYDNEPFTDFTTANGEQASTVEAFAHGWTAGKSCRATNHAVQQEVSPAHPKYDACAAIFQAQTSAFRPCFKQMDPTPFMQMCINGDTCKVASFYVSECNTMEVPIRMLRQCVTCQLPSGTPLSEGQEETIQENEVPKKADVIFVVSHGRCNQEAIPKMAKLANQIVFGMKEQGVINVHFGIVGFGGEDFEVHPLSHTMDGHLLNSKTTFIRTMSKFQTMTFDNEEEDAMSAVKFAAHYNFRAGASKSIVLMPCHKCNTKKMSYSTIQTALSDQDIKFHLMIHEDFKLKANSNSPKSSFMYGIDRTSVFTGKDARGSFAVGDEELRRHTLVPKGLCMALTHETDGSVFNLRKFTETKLVVQKRFATVFGRVVAKKGVPATCQRCECKSDESGVGVAVCNPCAPLTQHVYTWDTELLPEPDVPFSRFRGF